ncbi:MAG: formate dehydrogenase accessory sulfurtransferase FdhD [Proteobacteria bacterium]|nr:formate dehydrogenase accessory sulfurtransferase FdhD [Pseudomonadota bacterium]
MSDNNTKTITISKCNNNRINKVDDYLAVESPLEIRLAHANEKEFKSLAITMCSPDDIDDLIVGYLFTENIIRQAKDIVEINIFDNKLGLIAEIIFDKSIAYDQYLNKRHGMVHASCGVCGKTEFDDLLTFDYTKINVSTVNPNVIQSLPGKLDQAQIGFKQTGGLHASALFDTKGELIFVREDIGRHNALDKLIGAALQKGLLPLLDYIVLLSGRVSFELVHKSLLAGVPTLCAIGAPSLLSVEIAKLNNMCLFGFVKNDGFNQYCGNFNEI